MTQSSERVAPALALLAFGLAPWVDCAVWLLFDMDSLSGSDGATAAMLIGLSVLLGGAAAVVALSVGAVALLRARREAGAASEQADGEPRRPQGTARRTSSVARAATLIAIVGLWGPAGVGMIAPGRLRRGVMRHDYTLTWLVVGVTGAAMWAGIVLLVRALRQRQA